MSDAATKKKNFKESFNNFTSKTKTTLKNAKVKASDYNSAVQKAYKVGWNAGYEAQKQIPSKLGVKVVATTGFANGFKNGQKRRKYTGK